MGVTEGESQVGIDDVDVILGNCTMFKEKSECI